MVSLVHWNNFAGEVQTIRWQGPLGVCERMCQYLQNFGIRALEEPETHASCYYKRVEKPQEATVEVNMPGMPQNRHFLADHI